MILYAPVSHCNLGSPAVPDIFLHQHVYRRLSHLVKCHPTEEFDGGFLPGSSRQFCPISLVLHVVMFNEFVILPDCCSCTLLTKVCSPKDTSPGFLPSLSPLTKPSTSLPCSHFCIVPASWVVASRTVLWLFWVLTLALFWLLESTPLVALGPLGSASKIGELLRLGLLALT